MAMPRLRPSCSTLLCLALLALLLTVPSAAGAQELSLGTPSPDAPAGLDLDALATAGWSEASPGLWTRRGASGVVQKLAFGEGRLQLVPALQAELERLVGQIGVEPSPRLFRAIDQLTTTLETIHGVTPHRAAEKKEAVPLSCYPSFLSTYIFTFAAPPPGWHSIVATASAYWDGDGYPCPGHVYARAEYSLYHSTYGSLYDLDWCADDDGYEGGCWVGVETPYFSGFLSCHSEAYAYLSAANGAVILSEEKESNTC
jgi:hypothetical protein